MTMFGPDYLTMMAIHSYRNERALKQRGTPLSFWIANFFGPQAK
jgi:hypothetical protein